MHMRKNDYALIKLHKKYDISFIVVLDLKYSQQYVDFFRILKRVERLVYRLNLSSHWRIHSVLFIIQLKSASVSHIDFFQRFEPNHSESVFVESDTSIVKFYEIKRLINKRQTKQREMKYLIRERGYKSKNDDWKNIFELSDAMNLIKNYENVMQKTVTLPDKLFTDDITRAKKSERFSKTLTIIASSISTSKKFIAAIESNQ